MKEIDNVLDSLTKLIDQSIEDFSECKDINQRKTQAEIIKLLCESMGVFFDAMNDSMPYPFDNFNEMDDYDDEDEEYELQRHRKAKSKKNSSKDKIPF